MYIMCVMFIQRFEPRGRRFTNFHYDDDDDDDDDDGNGDDDDNGDDNDDDDDDDCCYYYYCYNTHTGRNKDAVPGLESGVGPGSHQDVSVLERVNHLHVQLGVTAQSAFKLQPGQDTPLIQHVAEI